MARLKEMYDNEIVKKMTEKFGYKNPMQVPKLDKIVINMAVGEAKDNAKVLDAAVRDLEIISGQKAVVTKAKKSVANFKLREGMPIGCKVTLRGSKMYEFADRLINLALPRVRDFRGVNPNAEYSRCRICGRPHAYLKKYGICRICFRELAYKGQIPGVKKASW